MIKEMNELRKGCHTDPHVGRIRVQFFLKPKLKHREILNKRMNE